MNCFIVRAPIGQVLRYGTIISKSVDHDNNVTSLVCRSENSDDYVVLVRASDNGAPRDGDGAVFQERLLADEYAHKITGWWGK